jgi:hypothetical protein
MTNQANANVSLKSLVTFTLGSALVATLLTLLSCYPLNSAATRQALANSPV